MACRPGNLAKTTSNLLPAPTRGNGFAERIQIRQCAIAANSTTGGRYADKYQTWQRIRATNRLSANIAEPAVATASYTSDVAAHMRAGANKYTNTMNRNSGELKPDSGIHHRTPGGDLPCGNNSHVAKDLTSHSEGTAWAGRLQVCCAGFQYVAGA
jgi:hypothetical protein